MARTSKSPNRTQTFWNHIDRICDVVDTQVKKRDVDPWGTPLNVQHELAKLRFPPRALIDDVLAFVEELQKIRVLQHNEQTYANTSRIPTHSTPPRASCFAALKQFFSGGRTASDNGKPAGDNPGMDRFLRECHEVLIARGEKTSLQWEEFRRRSDEVLMENLTAAWLALYFLGMPFIHPWERVRRIADYRGGFPSGGCIAKYVGDVYKNSRRRLGRDIRVEANSLAEPFDSETNESSMLILSHVPYVLLPGLLNCADDDDITPPSVHVLGRLYAALQMRLYLEKGPAAYFVPIDGLNRALQRLEKLPAPDGTMRSREEILEDVVPWLYTLFPKYRTNQSVKLLPPGGVTDGLPTCILGPRIGIYSLETGNAGLHFSGNQIHDALLESYRKKLQELSRSEGPDLLKLPPDKVTAEIMRLLVRVDN
jgi:hypothetical protein